MLFKKSLVSTLLQLIAIVGNFIFGIILAQNFGASAQMDAYVVVANFIALVFGLFSHIQSKAMLPYIASLDSDTLKKTAVSSIFKINNIVFLGVSALFFLFSDFVVFLLAPGLEKWQIALAGKFMKISAFYLFASNVVSLGKAVIEYHLQPYLSLLLNLLRVVILVAFLLLFKDLFQIYVLPYSHLFSLLLLIPLYLLYYKRKGYKLWCKTKLVNPDVKAYAKLMLPIFVGQIFIWVIKLSDTWLASFLSEGALSHVSYSLRIVNYFSLFFAGINTVYFPILARLNSRSDDKEYVDRFYEGFQTVFLLSLAMTGFIVLFAPVIISILFERKNFTAEDTKVVATLLRFYGLMLLCAPIGSYLANAYYSRKLTGKATFYSVLSSSLNIILNFILVIKFKVIGLAIASSLAFLLGNILQAFNLKSVNELFKLKKMFNELVKGVAVVSLGLVSVYFIAEIILAEMVHGSWVNQVLYLSLLGICYTVIVLVMSFFCGFPYSKILLDRLKAKLPSA